MRTVIWLVLLFAVAVMAALTLGSNDGLATIYWNGWRLDVSLNLFLLVLAGTCFALVTAINTVNSLISLPKRAREWRLAQRERLAQAALHESLAEFYGARYSRAQKAAQKALTIQSQSAEMLKTVMGSSLPRTTKQRNTACPPVKRCGRQSRSAGT